MNKSIKIKEGEYTKEDDIVLEIVQEIPQPAKIEKSTYSVKEIRREIEDLTVNIDLLTAKRKSLEDILKENKTIIQGAIKK